MNLKIKTFELQDMVGKAIKCVSNNKLIPLTSLMSLKVKDNIFTITTTDATNYFYVNHADKVDCEDFEVSVIADTFTKLIQKTTAEYTTLQVDAGVVKVIGNGTYIMELPLDENGYPIKFPKKYDDGVFRHLAGTIKLTTIKSILAFNKASLATSVELPSLTCYYCGEQVLTSDRFKICSNGVNLFNVPILLSAQFMELAGVMSSEDINVTTTESDIAFISEKEVLYAPWVDGIDTFPVTAILNLVNSEFGASCKVTRTAVLDLLDRLSLFVSKYDKKVVRMTFTNEGIMFSSKKSSGVELIPYVESNNFHDYTCFIDIEMFRSQVASQVDDIINLYYGSDIAVKLVSNNITQIVALAEDD